jgi:hypothetical protein
MHRSVLYTECDYHSEKFITLRLAERSRFPQGEEVDVYFTGRQPLEGFGMARRAAMVYAGLLDRGGKKHTVPCVSELGPYQGRVVGSQSPDGRQGWRIDWNPRTGQFHVNWWDRRLDAHGKRDRSVHYYGANNVTGGTQDLFWQIEQHFPGM